MSEKLQPDNLEDKQSRTPEWDTPELRAEIADILNGPWKAEIKDNMIFSPVGVFAKLLRASRKTQQEQRETWKSISSSSLFRETIRAVTSSHFKALVL